MVVTNKKEMVIVFARVKQSRNGEYLQVVESYRDGGRVRQRMVLYVGHYGSLDEALEQMPQVRRRWRSWATRTGSESARREADALDKRLRTLQGLVERQPDLLERDRKAAARRARQVAARNRARLAARDGQSPSAVLTCWGRGSYGVLALC